MVDTTDFEAVKHKKKSARPPSAASKFPIKYMKSIYISIIMWKAISIYETKHEIM